MPALERYKDFSVCSSLSAEGLIAKELKELEQS